MNRACCEAFIMYYSACVICVVAFIKKNNCHQCTCSIVSSLVTRLHSISVARGHSHGHSHGHLVTRTVTRTVARCGLRVSLKKKLVEVILTLRPPTFHSVVIISVLFLQYYCCAVHNTWLLFGHNIVLNVLFTLL